jgi:hypothetical protein
LADFADLSGFGVDVFPFFFEEDDIPLFSLFGDVGEFFDLFA